MRRSLPRVTLASLILAATLVVEPFTAATAATTFRGVRYQGEGFEACEAPSLTKMTAWLKSPYRAIGIYFGGGARGCPTQTNLNASWVSTVIGQGWKLIPTYVGRQAPCQTKKSFKIDPTRAASQGRADAVDAVQKAQALGLGTRSPLYFDMEAYPDSDTACVNAVMTFLDAWTEKLHSLNYLSGVYGSSGSTIEQISKRYNDPAFTRPDQIWFANWNGKHSVFGDPYFPDSQWSNRQRIHQYRGGHHETWGGQTINIDNDNADALLVGDPTLPRVAITSPVWGATVAGTVPIALEAADNTGVKKVTVYIDGVSIGSDLTAPYARSWRTTSFSEGTHFITAVVTDQDDRTVRSGGIRVRVDNPGVATVTPPTTLTGSIGVVFSEDVKGLNANNVVLRLRGSTESIPARVSCRTASGTAVSCWSGPVRFATLDPAPHLVPGQHYTVRVNPDGVPAVADVDGGKSVVATTRYFRGSRNEQQNSVAATYRWRTGSTSLAYGGSYRMAHFAGASLRYRVTGTSVTWYARTGPNHGIAEVSVDGKVLGTRDLYSSEIRYRVGRTYRDLGAGTHTITITALGTRRTASTGLYVNVDAFRPEGGPLVETPSTRDRWSALNSLSASGGSYVRDRLATASVSFTFRGTGVEWFYVGGPTHGKAAIYLDGRRVRTEDHYRSATTYGLRRYLHGLSDELHTVRIEVLGLRRAESRGTTIALDRFLVI